MRAVLALCAVSLLGACSLLLSYDGISDGPRAPEGGDATVADVRPDVVDASSDARDGGDASVDARVSVCTRAPAPTFCDDFDTLDLPAVWDIVDIRGVGGTVTRVSEGALSPPNRLAITANPVDAGQSVTAAVDKTFPTLASRPLRAVLELDLRVEAVDNVGIVARFDIKSTPDDYSVRIRAVNAAGMVRIELEEAGFRFDGGAREFVTHGVLRTAPLGEWTHIKLEIDFATLVDAGTRNRVKGFANGELKIDAPLELAIPRNTPVLRVGATFVRSPSNALIFAFDDVRLDVTPL